MHKIQIKRAVQSQMNPAALSLQPHRMATKERSAVEPQPNLTTDCADHTDSKETPQSVFLSVSIRDIRGQTVFERMPGSETCCSAKTAKKESPPAAFLGLQSGQVLSSCEDSRHHHSTAEARRAQRRPESFPLRSSRLRGSVSPNSGCRCSALGSLSVKVLPKEQNSGEGL